MPVNAPPITILLSDCTTIVLTWPLGFGLKPVSSVPSALSRARELRVVIAAELLDERPGATALNNPPSIILPSGCTAIADTDEFTDGSNAVSSEPLAFSRRMFERGVDAAAPTPCTDVNVPPTRIRPSG